MTSKKRNIEIGKRYFTVRENIFKRKIHVFLNYDKKGFAKWTGNKKLQEESSCENWENNFAGFSTDINEKDGPTEWVILVKHFD